MENGSGLGNISSQTPLIGGVSMRGLSINSEEGLMPPQEKIYNPAIKGFARSNARIQARQNGLLFLEKMCRPVRLSSMRSTRLPAPVTFRSP